MARLLVDMNLATEWIPLLQAAGHTTVHWSEVSDPRAPDTVLMQWAIAYDYTVFTHDLDFGTMLAFSGAEGTSVLQVRCLNVLPEAIGTLVLSVLLAYADEIEQGALVVADERRARVRIHAADQAELRDCAQSIPVDRPDPQRCNQFGTRTKGMPMAKTSSRSIGTSPLTQPYPAPSAATAKRLQSC